jgi:hypothetical protein
MCNACHLLTRMCHALAVVLLYNAGQACRPGAAAALTHLFKPIAFFQTVAQTHHSLSTWPLRRSNLQTLSSGCTCTSCTSAAS